MSNILTFPQRGQRAAARQTRPVGFAEYVSPVPVGYSDTTRPATVQFLPDTPAKALEHSLDQHRSTLLELAHRRAAFELQMRLEENTAQLKLEAAGYKALVAGVPESDIYSLGEDMAEALHSAMNTVAGA